MKAVHVKRIYTLASARCFRQLASGLYSNGLSQPVQFETEQFEEDGTTSIRDVTNRLGQYPSVHDHSILKENLMHPYQFMQLHILKPDNFNFRSDFWGKSSGIRHSSHVFYRIR